MMLECSLTRLNENPKVSVNMKQLFGLLNVFLLLILVSEASQKKKVLSFGGNGMIGSAVLHR